MSLEAMKSLTTIRNIAELYLPQVYFSSNVNCKTKGKIRENTNMKWNSLHIYSWENDKKTY